MQAEILALDVNKEVMQAPCLLHASGVLCWYVVLTCGATPTSCKLTTLHNVPPQVFLRLRGFFPGDALHPPALVTGFANGRTLHRLAR